MIIDLDNEYGLTNTELRVAPVPVTASSVDIGAKADAVASSDIGTFSLISLIKKLLQGITFLFSGDWKMYQIDKGNLYFKATGKTTLVAAGNFRATLENPSGSGKTIYIYGLVVASDASASGWANVYLNPTTGLPPIAVEVGRNLDIGSVNTSVLVIKADTSMTTPLSGGTKIGDMMSPPNSERELTLGLYKLPPNTMLGLNVVFAGAASSNVTIFYKEI